MNRPSTLRKTALAAMLYGGWLVTSTTIAQPIVDDVDIVNASKELRRVLYQREELREQLRELQRDADQIKTRLKAVNEIVVLQKELDDLWSRIDKAKQVDNKPLFASLEQQAEQLELTIEHRRDMVEIDGELRELAPLVAYLREIEQNDYAEPVTGLVKSLREFREVSVRLHQIYLKGPEPAEAPLEERSERLHEEIELGRDFVDLLRELREAREEEEYERSEELEAEIQALQRDDKAAPHLDDEAQSGPTRGPILVTDEALARVAPLGFQHVVPLFKTYCFDCHGNETQSGELNIEAMISARPIVKNRDKWINVLEQAKNRVMPPEDETQPSEQERTMLVLTLHNAVYNFDYSHIVDPGFELARRLTHAEYDNTIGDLFGVDVRPARKFPTDLVGTSGFDNSANSLFIQPLLMERYLGAAEEVVDAALPRQPRTDEQRRARALTFVQEPSAKVDDVTAAEAVFRRYLLRAYRRPLTEEELARSLHQFQLARRQGLDFFAATKVVLRTTLISPNFLLKSESDQDTTAAHRITDWDLASRLSYFLWTSMPDTELFDLAAQGRLHHPQVLKAQVERMIADPKSDTLGTIFIAQWLGSQHLGTRMRLDPIDNPWCTETLMAAMRNETAMFFHTLVKDNQQIQRLIDADFTFLNEELAKHYRIPGVVGQQMQRVSLKTDRRGGIFGQGSLLAVTSFPYRTSPVVRGRWILGDVLGTPPPPPPPNVSELPEEIEENRRLTFRQKLERHRRARNCYACHSQMDPLGFSLENYDWFGRWRTKIRRRTVDAHGKLPNGTEFEGLAGLKKVIIEQRMDDLVRQIASKMLSYALGRQLEYYDVPAVRKIVAAVKEDDYRFHTLLHEVVMSYPFQYKKKPTVL